VMGLLLSAILLVASLRHSATVQVSTYHHPTPVVNDLAGSPRVGVAERASISRAAEPVDPSARSPISARQGARGPNRVHRLPVARRLDPFRDPRVGPRPRP